MRSYPDDVQAFIAENVQGTTTKDLAELVNARFSTNFTESSMKSYKTNHKLKSGTPCGLPAGRSTDLYPTEVREFINSHFIGVGHQGMADLLNENFGTSYTKGQMKAIYSRFKLNSGRTGRFPKGHAPANKGMKGYCAPGCEKTWFPKGNQSRNHRVVGDEALRDDGYIWIKIAEPNKWRQKHVVIWETANGPRPKKHGVIFGDGNRLNFALENLLLVSQAQLLALNRKHLIQNDVDLTRTGILIVDVDRKILERRNPMKSQITDENIFALIDEGKKNSEIARHFGMSQASINKRINILRQKHEFNLKDGEKKKEPDLAAKVPFPFYQDELILYDRENYTVEKVSTEELVIRKQSNMQCKHFTLCEYEKNRELFRKKEKPPITKQPQKPIDAGEIPINGTPIKGLPDEDKQKIVDKLKEEVGQPIVRHPETYCGHFPDPAEKPVEDLFQSDPASIGPAQEAVQNEIKLCVHFLQDCTHPELDNCEECSDFKDAAEAEKGLAVAIESAASGEQPLHIFKDEDYTDEAWGGAEKEISDTVLSRRDYLDKIDQLLDVMMPCAGVTLDDVVRLAMGMLGREIRKEAGAEDHPEKNAIVGPGPDFGGPGSGGGHAA